MAKIKLHNPHLAENSSFGNFVVESLATDPTLTGIASSGRIWFNSTEKKLKGAFLDGAGTAVDLKYLADAADITTINNSITNLENQVDGNIGDLTSLTTEAQDTVVAAINELGTEIGTVENLSTTATSLTTAVNELDTELGTITAVAMGTTADTVSGAIAEHQADIGEVTSLSTTATSLTTAINELDTELGTITAVAMGTTADTVSGAIAEHQADIGEVTGLTTTSKVVVGAINELDAELGTITAGAMGTTATTVSGAIAEHQADIGEVTSLTTTSKVVVGAINELDALQGNDTLSTTATTLTAAINELDTDKVEKIDITGATVGSSTAIPVITYNTQGQITSTTTATIDITLQGVTDLGNTSDNAIVLADGVDGTTAGLTADFLTTANAVTAGSADISGTLDVGGATTVGTSETNADLTVYGNETVTGNVVVQGDLTVSGTQVIVETEILKVADNIITLNNGIGAVDPTENAGLEVDRGNDGVLTFLQFNETSDTVQIAVWNGVDAFTMVDVATSSDSADIQSELDSTQTSLGFTDTVYSPSNSNYIAGSTVTADIDLLDSNLKRVEDGVGVWGSLTTTSKVVVGAINELDGVQGNDTLTTVASTLTAAVNELDLHANNIYDAIGSYVTEDAAVIAISGTNYMDGQTTVSLSLGKLDTELKRVEDGVGVWGDLTTTATTVVTAINELDGEVGVLSGLTTTATDTIVNAINEVDLHANNLYDAIGAYVTEDATALVITGTNYLNSDTTVSAALTTLDSTLKTRADAINTAAGISSDAYTASETSNYLTASDFTDATLAENLFNADLLLDAKIKSIADNTDGNIGDLATLTTTEKGTLVGAINELDALQGNDTLTTTGSTLTAAVNELDAKQGNVALTTTAQTTTGAISELDAEIGVLTGLNTDAKGTLVAAINEVDTHANNLYTAAGSFLSTDATAFVITGTNYLNSDTTLTAALTTLDSTLKTRADDINTAAGIASDSYTASETSNYLKAADFTGATLDANLFNADVLLDAKLKSTIDVLASTTATEGSGLVGYSGYTEDDANIVSPTVEITAGTVEAAITDICESVNLKIHEIENRYVKGEVADVDKSDVYTIAHNLDTSFVDVSVQVYDPDELVWRFDLVVVEVVDSNTVKISLAGGIAYQIRYVIHGY